ncbi:EamA-like transporter family protein [Olleya aquimaris]|uniref:EamA-like transporter family protein n=2 Tax=Olleya aquimaris TaxID=639310 RepID=A0A327RCC8_9FLAO|nr:EamA-like transporter family protein [Olleya aquimaris]
MIISALAFTLLNVGVKYLGKFNVYQIVFFRALGSLFFTFPFLLKNKISFIGNKVKLLVARSIVGLIAMTMFFASIKLLPTGTAVSIRYIAPIFAALFALFLLKERIKPIQWLFFIAAFCGVLMLKGLETNVDSLGFVFALISALFTGLVFIIIRRIGNQDHPMVIVNYFMVTSFIIAGILSIKYWIQPIGIEWVALLSLGVFGYFGQIYMTKALQTSETRLVAPLKYIEVVFTMLAGVIWFTEDYTIVTILGMILIITSLVLNVIVVKRKQ